MLATIEITEHMRSAIAECEQCAQVCLEAATTHCLSGAGAARDPVLIRLLLDCGDLCRTSSNFLLRGSEYANYPVGICAHLCDQAAGACEAALDDDPVLAACARACRGCAATCLELSKHWRQER